MRSIQFGLLSLLFILTACSTTATLPPVQVTAVAPTTAPPPTPLAAEATSAFAATEALPTPGAATPAPEEPTAQPTPTSAGSLSLSGTFVKEEVPVRGSYTLDPASGQLRFSDDFTVVPGPDLYVILSGASDLTVDYVTFSRAVDGAPRLTLGALASSAGAQTYVIPAGTGLSVYRTVVVWCQSFSVAFAAAPLQP